ncbi:MAG: Na(+)-translocating NADH-quinone reductase subunit C [Thiogranum sp.]
MPEERSGSRNNETIGKTLLVAVTLCLVCSLVVSTAAVTLRPLQAANKALDMKRNILLAAGLLAEGEDVEVAFDQVQPRLVDLSTGDYVTDADPALHDPQAAVRDPAQSVTIPPQEDLARIRRRARIATVYVVEYSNGLRSVILPVYGAGLYSTLYGFIALAGDANRVQGVRFYEHGETPGLGGEIDNPRWLAKWTGKQLADTKGQLRISVVKGGVDPDSPEANYQVDAISGATVTSRGVSNLMRYWLGEQGFGPFLAKFRSQGA